MPPNVASEIAALPRLRVSELRARFAAVCGEPTLSHNKVWLVKRIAWRLQALAEGGLCERALRRAAELANDADLRLAAPRTPRAPTSHRPPPQRQHATHHLPIPGTVLIRPYKGQTLQVRVLPKGFEFDGQVYRSLSAAAKAATGSHCSGHFFFGLAKRGAKP